MKNIGNSCYINAIIQVLVSITCFTDDLRIWNSNKSNCAISSLDLFFSFISLISERSLLSPKTTDLSNLKALIDKSNSAFEGSFQQVFSSLSFLFPSFFFPLSFLFLSPSHPLSLSPLFHHPFLPSFISPFLPSSILPITAISPHPLFHPFLPLCPSSSLSITLMPFASNWFHLLSFLYNPYTFLHPYSTIQ